MGLQRSLLLLLPPCRLPPAFTLRMPLDVTLKGTPWVCPADGCHGSATRRVILKLPLGQYHAQIAFGLYLHLGLLR